MKFSTFMWGPKEIPERKAIRVPNFAAKKKKKV
jgi:hypothetical protein